MVEPMVPAPPVTSTRVPLSATPFIETMVRGADPLSCTCVR